MIGAVEVGREASKPTALVNTMICIISIIVVISLINIINYIIIIIDVYLSY